MFTEVIRNNMAGEVLTLVHTYDGMCTFIEDSCGYTDGGRGVGRELTEGEHLLRSEYICPLVAANHLADLGTFLEVSLHTYTLINEAGNMGVTVGSG